MSHQPSPLSRRLARITAILAGTLGLAFVSEPAIARPPVNGLTVAISPKGDTLVAGGYTRVLMLLDPKTLAVKRRIHVDTTVVDLAFSANGDTLMVMDTDDSIHLYDTRKWQRKAELRQRTKPAVHAKAGLIAAAEVQGKSRSIVLHAIKDGAEQRRFALEAESNVLALGFDEKGERLGVLLTNFDSKQEPKVGFADIPKDLRGMDRTAFQQKNDGKTGRLLVFDVKSGSKASDAETFFSLVTNNARLVLTDDAAVVINASAIGARIGLKGETDIFSYARGGSEGVGVSHDNKLLLSGGHRAFAITRADSRQSVTGSLDDIPGWPEYVRGLDASGDGKTIFAGTSAYRVLQIDSSGKLLKAAPVY